MYPQDNDAYLGYTSVALHELMEFSQVLLLCTLTSSWRTSTAMSTRMLCASLMLGRVRLLDRLLLRSRRFRCHHADRRHVHCPEHHSMVWCYPSVPYPSVSQALSLPFALR
jgi:hypothetical protein